MATTTDPIREVAQMAAGAKVAMRHMGTQPTSKIIRLLKGYRAEHPSCTINRWVSENGLAPLVVDSRCDLCKGTDEELAALDAQ